jgi:ribosome-associated protein
LSTTPTGPTKAAKAPAKSAARSKSAAIAEEPAQASAPTAPDEPDPVHQLVMASLDDDQAQEVISIPLIGKSTLADYMVIASGRSTRQVAAMAEHLMERLKREQGVDCKVEGLPQADWVLVDASHVIVHLFRPEVRSFYNLEKMWSVGAPDRPMPRPSTV